MSNSQVTRLESGGMIQIRTGVIQGIGPQGPPGATGPIGDTGPVGPQGVPGPTGGVEDFSTFVTATTQAIATTTITSNYPTAYTNLQFPTVTHDELSAVQSSTNFRLPAGADYSMNCRVRFFKQAAVNGSGFRAIQAVYNGVVIGEVLLPAITTVDTIFSLQCHTRSTSLSHTLNFKVAHNEGVTINVSGTAWITRTGPGMQGEQGIQGIQGIQGEVGPQGPIGPAGSIVTSTTTIADIGGTNPA